MIPVDTSIRFATAWRGVEAPAGCFRASNADFRVDERLEPERDEAGNNLCLQLRKDGQNTHWLASQLAARIGAPEAEIGYAGRKDRHAITTQWFSVPRHRLAEETPEALRLLLPPNVELLATVPVRSRLRPGHHAGNRFCLVVRELALPSGRLDERLQQIGRQGVPNYFGEQRFGRDRNNIARGAELLLARRLGRHPQRSLLLSALRSWLFNVVLSARVSDGTWLDSGIADGPLWGRGRSGVAEEIECYEREAMAGLAPIRDQLEFSGLSNERRSLVLRPTDFSSRWLCEDVLQLEFSLPPGAYATSVLRELGDFVEGPLC